VEDAHTGVLSCQRYTVCADGTKLARRSFDVGDRGGPAWLPDAQPLPVSAPIGIIDP
jgi:hypothetical protein